MVASGSFGVSPKINLGEDVAQFYFEGKSASHSARSLKILLKLPYNKDA